MSFAEFLMPLMSEERSTIMLLNPSASSAASFVLPSLTSFVKSPCAISFQFLAISLNSLALDFALKRRIIVAVIIATIIISKTLKIAE